jgi:hypothetical protein
MVGMNEGSPRFDDDRDLIVVTDENYKTQFLELGPPG